MTMQEMIKDAVQSRLGDGYAVDVQEVVKNNGTKQTGMTIHKAGQTVAPTLYIDKYVDMTEGELMNAADELVAQYRQHEDDLPNFTLGTKDEFLSKVCYRVVNAERNFEMLKDAPHKLLLDLAITYRMIVDVERESLATALITNRMIESLGITPGELDTAARKNAEKYSIKTMQEIMAELMGMEPDMLDQGSDFPMYVISNKDRMFGATVLAYNEELKRIADSVNSDLYILPSSIHEVLAIPMDGAPLDLLRSMVPEVNTTTVAADEVLSDSVYMFVRENGELEVAA